MFGVFDGTRTHHGFHSVKGFGFPVLNVQASCTKRDHVQSTASRFPNGGIELYCNILPVDYILPGRMSQEYQTYFLSSMIYLLHLDISQ